MDRLVSTTWLADHLGDPNLRILECSVEVVSSSTAFTARSGRSWWEQGHIPNSDFADLTDALSDPDSSLTFTMPKPDEFAAAMTDLGVGDGTEVVLYDRLAHAWAARVWWMLRAVGFDGAAVLDGGWRAWEAEDLPVSTDPAPIHPPATLTTRPRPELFADIDDVRVAISDEAVCICNALGEAQHRGDVEDHHGRSGHIPTAVNVPAVDLVDGETHRFVSDDELRARFAAVGALDANSVVTYCGGGIAASSDAFVLTLLGHPNVAVYDGSLGEWAADPANPLVID